MAGLFKKKSSESAAASGTGAVLPDDKKSRSEIKTRRTNIILVAIAFLMLGVFVVGANFVKTNKDRQDEILELAGTTIAAPVVTEVAMQAAYIPPVLSWSPQSIDMTDATVGEETFRPVALSVANAPVKIANVAPSSSVDGLGVDNDCVDKIAVMPETGCIINVFWTPEKKENKNIFIAVTYADHNDGTDAPAEKSERNAMIPVALRSSAPEAPAQVQPPADDFFEDDFFEEEEPPADEEIAHAITEAEPLPPPATTTTTVQKAAESAADRRTIYPDDCKKYASKSYDFSGVFLGWVQGNNDVFSPNCGKIIGVLQDDGNVIEAGTGKILGKGAIRNKKKSEDMRIELALPVLAETMNAASGEGFSPPIEDVANNRELIKATERRASTEEYDLYKSDDPLNMFKGQKNALIPFTITNSDQVSSMPKDERYVLRQSKPIPAVLTRPIYFSGAPGSTGGPNMDSASNEGQANAMAVVERNVYGGDGRTVIIPSGSQLIGTATEPAENGLNRINKIPISWTRLIRPDGAEFDLGRVLNYTGDAQGRAGVPGKNDTEYMKDLVINPLLYSVLPVAMEALFPTSSKMVTRVRRSDGTYQVVDGLSDSGLSTEDTTGTSSFDLNPDDIQTVLDMSSKDKMKFEIQQNWKNTATKLLEESMKTSIPFTVPAGTRITVFLNRDVMLRIDEEMNDMIDAANPDYKYTEQ
jgi:type IV secretory pathway VirB10-like protein